MHLASSTDPQLDRRVSVIKALAHPSRLTIAEALQAGPVCVGDLEKRIGADMSTVSKHLSLMRNAGLVTCERRGVQVFYRLTCVCLPDFLRCIDELCPPGESAPGAGCCES